MTRTTRVAGVRYLFWRGSGLTFRWGVPSYARSEFDNRAEVQVALGTGNLTDARYRLAREVAKFDAKLQRAKRARAASGGAAVSSYVPSTVEIDEVVTGARVNEITQLRKTGHFRG